MATKGADIGMLPHRTSTAIISGLSERVPSGTVSLAGLYFLSSASMFLWAYMPSQMSALGWTGAQIGLFFTVKTISQAVATPAWAQLADRPEKSRPRLLKTQYLLAAVAVALLPVAGSWSLGIIVAVLIGATVRCSLPLMDTMTLGTVGLNRFGRIRAFGTAGFGLVALLFGLLGSQLEHRLLAASAPWVMFVLLALAVPLTANLPGATPDTGDRPERQGSANSCRTSCPDVGSLLKSPVVLVVFPVAALFAATYVPYDLFLVSLAEERGFGAWLPGMAIFIGVVGELLGFLSFRNIVRRIGPELVIGAVVAITGIRWFLTGTTHSPVVFAGLQILHGLTFAAFFLAMLEIMTRHWGSDLGATPQGLLYLLVFTAGGGLGTMVAGIGYDIGSAAWLFQNAGLVSFVVLPFLLAALWFAARLHDRSNREASFAVQSPRCCRYVRRPRPQLGMQLTAARRRYARTTVSSSTSSRM